MQEELSSCVRLENIIPPSAIKLISGVDIAYWSKDDREYGVCSIVTIDRHSGCIVESKSHSEEITFPYIPGYLSFRELPLITRTFELISILPDIVMFDGNGVLHYRKMGIATHASFFLNKPTIGVAKSYLRVGNADFIMPDDTKGSFSDIIVDGICLGRALRTRTNVKPVFVSSGNWIDLDSATEIVLDTVSSESRLPLPTRLADIETRRVRAHLLSCD